MQNPFLLNPNKIEEKSKAVRRKIIKMNSHAGSGHTGADLSETDILTSLYFRLLRYDIENLKDPDRDRFILSKGHGIGGLYCTLAETGILPEEELLTYLQAESHLPGHPVRQKTPGIEINTGALGHGLPIACGLALAAKKTGQDYLTYVLTGDGELQEGSVWETAMAASYFKLDNLIVINDRNTLQLADRTEKTMPLEPLADKWKAFGFNVLEADGNSPESLVDVVESIDFSSGKPHVIIARTIKGKGVSFIENQPAWHHRVPVGDEITTAIEELE